MAVERLTGPAGHAVGAGRIVMFGCRGIDMPDVARSTATRYDLDVNVEDATAEFLRAATQTNREGGPR